MAIKQAIEVIFAGKGWFDHVQGATDEKAKVVDQVLAGAGLGADAVGTAQMVAPVAAKLYPKVAPVVEGAFPKAASFASKAIPKVAALETPIIGSTLLAINALSLTLGIGDPETGHRFEQGASKFEGVRGTLESATPTGQWVGDGSEAYRRQNERQQVRAEHMRSTDGKLKSVIASQADQVLMARRVLDGAATALTACIPAAISLGLTPVPPVGVPAQLSFETTVSNIALVTCGAALQMLNAAVLKNAMDITMASGDYAKDPHAAASGAKSGYMRVATGHVRALSSTQGQARGQIQAASTLTNGVSASMFANHGIACSAANTAVAMADSRRGSACSEMATASERLSDKLGIAADRYDSVDAAMSGRLGKQMHPR
ncbi:EspA/EspE family type VII secretion system effector [Mycobacterium sp. NPDC004974]